MTGGHKPLTDAGARLFTGSDIWTGGFYELIIHLGNRSDERLRQALTLLWQHDQLDGCWAAENIEPREERRVEANLRAPAKLYGIALLPGEKKAACLSQVKRQKLTEGKLLGIPKPDWLSLRLPMGAIATIYDVGTFPQVLWSEEARPWREKLDEWLMKIGRYIGKSVPYDFAMIGHELDGQELWRRLNNNDAPEPPEERNWGYLKGDLQNLDGRLEWHPPTTYS